LSHKILNLSIISLLFLISGCQSVKLINRQDANSPELKDIQNWQVTAKMAINTPEENATVTLEWDKREENFDFHIYGLLGATYAQLTQKDGMATLTLPDDQIAYHQDAEQLIYQAMGWDFPLHALSFWIKGIPSEISGEQISRDEKGKIKQIIFRDWQVDISRYQLFSGYSMPKMIKAKHPNLSLKIVIRNWQLRQTP